MNMTTKFFLQCIARCWASLTNFDSEMDVRDQLVKPMSLITDYLTK